MPLKSGVECWVKNGAHLTGFYCLSGVAFILGDSLGTAWNEVILWRLLVCTGCGTQ